MSGKEFRSPPMPENLSPKEQQDFLQRQGVAHHLKHKTGASYVYAAASQILGPNVSPESFVLYLNQLLEEAGNPKDPIERMLIEQIALAHHTIGNLSVRGATAQSVEAAMNYHAAAARLLGEFRRTALALKKYREPTPSKNVMLVRQQNVAQNQQVAYVEGDAGSQTNKLQGSQYDLKARNSEVGSNQSQKGIEHAPEQVILPQPQAGGGRETESVEAKRTHR